MVLVAAGGAGAGAFVGGPLVGAHRGGAGVGEQVDGHVGGAQQEGVVARRPDRLLALFPRQHSDLLDGVNLVGEGVELVGLEVRVDPVVLHLVAPGAHGARS